MLLYVWSICLSMNRSYFPPVYPFFAPVLIYITFNSNFIVIKFIELLQTTIEGDQRGEKKGGGGRKGKQGKERKNPFNLRDLPTTLNPDAPSIVPVSVSVSVSLPHTLSHTTHDKETPIHHLYCIYFLVN